MEKGTVMEETDVLEDAARWRFLVAHAVLITFDVRRTSGFLSRRVWRKSPGETRTLAQVIDLARAQEEEGP